MAIPRLLLVLATVVLAGCTAETDPQPVALPTVSASPTPSTTPRSTPTPSVTASAVPVPVPAAARAATPQGAAAFARFYFEQINQGFREPGTSVLAPHSDPQCQSCRNFISTLKSMQKEGLYHDGVGFVIIAAEAPPIESGYSQVLVSYELPKHNLRGRDGAVVEAVPCEPPGQYIATVQRKGSTWLMRGIEVA